MTTRPPSPALAAATSRLDARIDWEKTGRRDEMRVDVGPAQDLLARLGEPERRWRAVHVAGTKGKGSVAALVSAGLIGAGLRVGTYGSPHVERVTERVRIDLNDIDDDVLAASLEAALDAREVAEAEGTPAGAATWFDLMTAGAFHAFAASEVDWAVVEVGLGGRLDSTNTVHADVAVVTTIDLEHTEVLGSTRAAIAEEKAGILRANQHLVTGVGPRPALGRLEDAGSVIVAAARRVGAHLVSVPAGAGIEVDNLALAGTVLDCLGWRGHRNAAGEALSADLLDEAARAAARLPGRLEHRSLGGIPVILDGAHVGSSLSHVLDALERDSSLSGVPQVVLGMGRDKEASSILKALVGRVDRVLCTSVASPLARPAADLERLAREAGLAAERAADPEEAVAEACAAASPGGWVLVTGSLHLVGAVRAGLDDTPCD